MSFHYRLRTNDGRWHHYAAPTLLDDTLAECKARKLVLRSSLATVPIFPETVTYAVLMRHEGTDPICG